MTGPKILLHASAVHEAGHAVAVVTRGLILKSVNITRVVDNGVNRAGLCTYTCNKRLRTEAIIVRYAGPYAQYKAYPLLEWKGADNDFSGAEEYLEEAVKDFQGLTKDLLRSRCRSEARKLVNDHWHSIVRVADELLARQQLSGEEVEALITEGPPDPPPAVPLRISPGQYEGAVRLDVRWLPMAA